MVGVLKLLVMLVVLGVSVAMAVRFRKGAKGEPAFGVRPVGAVIGALLVVVTLLVLPAIGAIPAGHRGVVLRFGAVTETILDEGIYLVMPIVNSVERMSVQVVAYESKVPSASKDLQDVETQVTLNYYVDPSKVGRIYQTLRNDYEVRIIKPAIQEAIKASTALFDAEKLIGERPKVKTKIEEYLQERLKEHGIVVDAISITDFKFSEEFTKAIEAKVKATQRALEAKNDVERVKMEALQVIVKAKAEAISLKLKREQVTPMLIELKRLELQKEALLKWDGKLPMYITNNAPVPIMDVFTKNHAVPEKATSQK